MTHSHHSSSSFSSSAPSASATSTSTTSTSLSSTFSPSLVPSVAPLLSPSFSVASDCDSMVDIDKDKLGLFSLTISSPPPMINNESEIPPLSIAEEEEESFQIHLQHEIQKVSPSTSSSFISIICCSFSSLRLQFLFFIIFFILFLFSLFLMFLSTSHRCSMDNNLRRMFLDVTDAFKAHGVDYWLDSGTLLGAVRDGKIIPWEFDLDLGMMEEECQKLPKLKEYFRARGYELFVRNEFIQYKENSLMGYDGYLHAPCARIYQDPEYYTDIYWFQSVSKERREKILQNHRQKSGLSSSSSSSSFSSSSIARPTGPSFSSSLDSFISPPWNLGPSNNDEEWICSAEGFDPSGMPGGCNIRSDVLPTRQMAFLGGLHAIPARPESVLHGVYGDWQTPEPKGYKALFCAALPPKWMSGAAAVMSGLIAAACALQVYCQLWCGRRELWATVLKEIKRRLDEYYA